jgi:Cdc6-like AAA superfamily ATPase
MPMDRGTPDLVRHCVAAVAKQHGGDVQKAFAICVAQLQKAGYLKPGTIELTAAGKAKEKEHEAEPDAAKKLASYEKLLKAARKTEAAEDFYAELRDPTARTGYEGMPRTVANRHGMNASESPMEAMRRLAGITK